MHWGGSCLSQVCTASGCPSQTGDHFWGTGLYPCMSRGKCMLASNWCPLRISLQGLGGFQYSSVQFLICDLKGLPKDRLTELLEVASLDYGPQSW